MKQRFSNAAHDMRPIEIEAWTLKIVDAVKRNASHEDSRVECKAEWIAPSAAARRIAAHANAAGGEPILWLIGLDRQRGIVGAANNELSNWWSSVQSEFNELAPRMSSDLLIAADDKTIVALLFETDRAPFVVKAQDGYLVVPWREGTRTNSARRSALVHLLAPVVRLPQFDVMGGRVALHERAEGLRYLENSIRCVCHSSGRKTDRHSISLHFPSTESWPAINRVLAKQI